MRSETESKLKAEKSARCQEAAARALAEAAERRTAYDAFEKARPVEKGGRGGHDPARYGDWEKKGIASDF